MSKMYKIVLCGNYGVGKTSLVLRLIKNIFQDKAPPTIGASFLTWKADPREKSYYGIWDTAGQERFADLLPLYFRDAHIVIYCWDCRSPFDKTSVEKMYNQVRQYTNGFFYFVLTKSDLYAGEDFNSLKEWMKEIDYSGGVFITCSQNGQGVRELFADIDKRVKNNPLPPLKKEGVSIEPNKQRRNCCRT